MKEDQSYWKSLTGRRLSRRQALGAGLGAGALAGLALAGCGDDDDDEDEGGAAATGAATAAGAIKRGGTVLSWTTGDATGFDPQTQSNAFVSTMYGLTYSRLARFPLSMTTTAVVPDAAESWEVPDGATYIFKIRKGMKFHPVAPVNGRALDAEDIAKGVERIRTDSPQFQHKIFWTGLDKAQVVDSNTIRFDLKGADAAFLQSQAEIWNVVVLPKELTDLENENQIGTGPFMWDKYTRGTGIILKRHPDYFDTGFPRVDAIDFKVMPEAATQVAAFRANQIDYLSVPFDSLKEIKSSKPNAVYSEPISSGTKRLRINNARLTDVRVRQAILYAIDVDELIQLVWGGGAVRNGPMAPHWVDWALPQEKLPKPDKQRARKLLESAGAVGLELRIFQSANYRDNQEASIIIKDQLEAVGFKVKFDIVEHTEYLRTFFGTDWDLAVHSTLAYSDPADELGRNYGTGSSRNFVKLSDPKMDDFIKKLRTTLDAKERKKISDEAQAYYYEIVPAMPLVSLLTVDAFQARVKDFARSLGYGANGWPWVRPWLDS